MTAVGWLLWAPLWIPATAAAVTVLVLALFMLAAGGKR